MLITFYDSYRILNKVYSEGAYLKQAMISTPIEESNRPAISKICYGVLEKDIILSYWISELCDKNPKLVVRTLLKIAMYNIKFLNKAPYAVTDTTVELCNKLGKKGVSGFINAVLRKFIKTEFEYPQGEAGLALKYDFPVFAVKRLVNNYGREKAESIMGADAERTCIRFNNISGEEYLKKNNINFDFTPYNNVFFVDKFVRNADYDRGLYTFQSIGSAAICDSVSGGEKLLDACAAPGGKSVLLSEKFKNVIACELHEHRASLINDYVKRMGVNNVSVSTCDSSVYNEKYSRVFDAVLCDVPCSGFGVIKGNPDIKLNKDDNTVKQLNEIQYKILNNCAEYVKKNGMLYYSTCSYFNEENDGVINRFLENNKSFMPGVICPKIPYIKMNFGVQFLPDISFGAGFYICALRRCK